MNWRRGLGGATIILVLAGAAVALGWLQLTSGRDWLALGARVRPGTFALLLAVTTLNVLVRFIRWQYLLRRVGVRIATRPSLLIYVASLTAIATPAYIGELLRSVLVKRRFGVPFGRTVPVLLAERALDVFTLALVTAGTAETGFLRAVTAGLCGGMVLAWGLLVRFARTAPVSAAGSAGFAKHSVIAVALMLSALAWAPTGWLITIAANAIGVSVPASLGLPIFARATLLGGLSMMPAGIGATGSVAIVALTGHGISTSDAISVVSLLRLSTVGITLVTGLFCLVLTLRRATNDAGNDTRAHFDDLADEYDEQLPAHIRDLLIARKTALVSAALDGGRVPLVRGLDLGCGQGAHGAAMIARGYRIVGIDVSVRSVVRARRAGVDVVAGSALHLPFASGSFDFVYAIGVLHHVPEDWRAQVHAEVPRVLRPGGRLLVHETNPRNPLFRFYMGYVFPIARRIDEGTEQWLDPDHGMPGMTAIATEYVTFLPDFLPRWMLSWSIHIERWLERSRWRRYAAHYLKVFERNKSGGHSS